jgi:SAM-dependent methyltransferase
MMMTGNLRIDLGCGSVKKPGTLGVDMLSLPEVDYVVNLDNEPLPFPDNSVEYVHSSHFLEHVLDPGAVFTEISRVCRDGAVLDLWTPFAWSSDAFIFTHKTFFNEEHYLHMCWLYPDFYKDILHARWVLEEIQYVIRPEVLQELRGRQLDINFALKYCHNIAREFGVHITVHKNSWPTPPPYRRTFSVGRFADRYELPPESAAPTATVEEAIRFYARQGPLPPLAA